MKIEQKQMIREAIIEASNQYGASASAFAKSIGISPSIYSRIKNGELEGVLADTVWLSLARQFDVKLKQEHWNVARTYVYTEIENNLLFCQKNNKSMILVDDCGIGKTFCAKHISKGLKNAFYFDCSQTKTKQQFIRALARRVGLDAVGKYIEVKANLKYFLANVLENPLIILDEAGDLDYGAFLELKELWNATENACAWYMMGADGLRTKIQKGLNNQKVGFAEIFDRFSDEFIKLVPQGREDKQNFYRHLITSVATINASPSTNVNSIVNQCLKREKSLRHLSTLLKISA